MKSHIRASTIRLGKEGAPNCLWLGFGCEWEQSEGRKMSPFGVRAMNKFLLADWRTLPTERFAAFCDIPSHPIAIPPLIGLRLRAGIRPPAALARIYSRVQANTGVWWAACAAVGWSVRACV
jgi:hypothetical protein